MRSLPNSSLGESLPCGGLRFQRAVPQEELECFLILSEVDEGGDQELLSRRSSW